MKKILSVLVLTLLILVPSSVVMATPITLNEEKAQVTVVDMQQPITFESYINVGEDGGRFQVGFINVEFKKNFLNPSMLPTTFKSEVYAENGQVYIEFSPDTTLFYKQVHLRIDSYSGYVYDRALGENVYVNIKKSQVLAPHFSRYCVTD